MLTTHPRKKAFFALLLLVSAASLGITMALYIAPGSLGQMIFSLCKVWLLALPLVWFIWVDHGKFRLSLRYWYLGQKPYSWRRCYSLSITLLP